MIGVMFGAVGIVQELEVVIAPKGEPTTHMVPAGSTVVYAFFIPPACLACTFASACSSRCIQETRTLVHPFRDVFSRLLVQETRPFVCAFALVDGPA